MTSGTAVVMAARGTTGGTAVVATKGDQKLSAVSRKRSNDDIEMLDSDVMDITETG